LITASATFHTDALTAAQARFPERDITPRWLDAALCSTAVLLFARALSLLATV
jgi:hypothetical protein